LPHLLKRHLTFTGWTLYTRLLRGQRMVFKIMRIISSIHHNEQHTDNFDIVSYLWPHIKISFINFIASSGSEHLIILCFSVFTPIWCEEDRGFYLCKCIRIFVTAADQIQWLYGALISNNTLIVMNIRK